MNIPSAIFFVNADINEGIISTLKYQLFISEVLTDLEFDARVAASPDYVNIIHLNNLRIIVTRQDFSDYTNRNLADVVMFIKQGQASIEKNKFGPPGLTFPISRLNIYDLLRYVGSNQVVILPVIASPPPAFSLRGIVADQGADSSTVYQVNPDNEYNNQDFINRK